MYAERNPPEEPPCENCWVDLMPSNIEAAQIYLLNSGQRIMAGMAGETIDIDNNAIFRSMDAYPGEIRDKWACIKKVRATFHHFLNIERKKREADS